MAASKGVRPQFWGKISDFLCKRNPCSRLHSLRRRALPWRYFFGNRTNLFKPVRIVADRTLVPKTSPSLPRHLKLAPPLTVWSVCTELQICTGRPIRSARLSNRKRRLGGCEAKLDFQRPPVPLFETSSLAVPREPDTLSAFPLS